MAILKYDAASMPAAALYDPDAGAIRVADSDDYSSGTLAGAEEVVVSCVSVLYSLAGGFDVASVV